MRITTARSALLLTLLLGCGSPAATWAKVGRSPVQALIDNSDVIVVAQVESVRGLSFLHRIARARVREVWKGAPAERIEFVASRSWTCDVTEAHAGEEVLLFLHATEKPNRYEIAFSGRGRMPLRTVNGTVYATFWPEVRLPEGTPTIDGPEPDGDLLQSVELERLRELVRAAPEPAER